MEMCINTYIDSDLKKIRIVCPILCIVLFFFRVHILVLKFNGLSKKSNNKKFTGRKNLFKKKINDSVLFH